MNYQITTIEDAPLLFASAWNNHNMAEFAALFHPDATFVNRFDHYVKGVKDIVELHAPIHETIYSDSTLKNELIDVIPLSEGVVAIHFWSRLAAGAAHPVGPHEVDTVILAILIKQGDHWLFRALENVTLVNPYTGQVVLREIAKIS